MKSTARIFCLLTLLARPAMAQMAEYDLPPIQSLQEPSLSEPVPGYEGVETAPDWGPAPIDPLPINPLPAPVVPPPAPVQARPVPSLSLDALGLYPADKSERQASPAAMRAWLERLPPQLPASLRPDLTQALAQEWPAEGNGQGSLLARRATLLARWGAADLAARLLALVPAGQGNEDLAWARVEVAWLNAARPEACAAVEAGTAAYPESARWRMGGMLCRALDGRMAEAQLAIDLMDEQGQAVDPLLRHAIEAIRLKKPLADMEAASTVWNQTVLVEAGGGKALGPQLAQLPVPLLRRVATEPAFDAGLRKRAAARLVSVEAGVSPGEWLTPVRMEIPALAPDWQRREAQRTYAMLQALGEPVNPALAAALGVQPTAMSQNAGAQDAGLAAFESAAAARQVRPMLLQLAALLPPDLAAAPDGLLARLAQGLQQAGQRPLARQFAAESIAAIGAQARTQPAPKEPVKTAPKTPEAPQAKAAEKPAPAKPAAVKAAAPKPVPATPKATSPKPASPKPAKAVPKPEAPKRTSKLPKIDLP